MEDVRTRRRADVDSAHHMVVAKMKLRLEKHRTSEGNSITNGQYSLPSTY
ncbi:unnamed protein product [Schistosoma margrebowiei]|uniref:Uncharacterized protein n=1 Tax=Schistosoma margrebowiei TaxID=48269 RepID=A0A183LW25_9TREM|nr:unnamed protein product [Schistosoma margrebowiei]